MIQRRGQGGGDLAQAGGVGTEGLGRGKRDDGWA